ncbi:MAG: hypothetical protein Q9181_005655 [Wetmoreana brouardii]
MPKKRNPAQFSKPQSSVHPSISSASRNGQDDSHHGGKADKSVNDLLQHLRLSQALSPMSPESRFHVNPQTVHPSLTDILQIPETPPPRPRPGMRSSATRGRRRPPGPAPPRSWLENSIHAPAHVRRASLQNSSDFSQRPNLETLGTIPDLHLPEERTLQHQSLVQLASAWDWHVKYYQYYLATLPVRYKQILLSYIAKYSPNGIDNRGLETLFLDESVLEDATATDGLTHLDLAVSIGRSISLQDVKHFLATKNSDTNVYANTPTSSIVPDSWETEDITTTLPISPSSSLLPPSSVLATLTHLSLSHPRANISWRHLLTLSPLLSTLTHLSLAYWPVPTLTPNSSTAFRSTPTGNVDYGDHNHYSHKLDIDFSGAASVLRRLSRDTYCLRWLDLTGCKSWISALAWRKGGIEWDGAWSGLETVVVSQGWIPPVLQEEGLGWKKIIYYDEPCEVQETRTLRRWTSDEIKARDVLSRIRGAKETVVLDDGTERDDVDRNLPSRARWDDGGDEGGRWEAGMTKLSEEYEDKVKKRNGVVFDRGWEGWWIEDCLNYYEAWIMDSRETGLQS